jgi:tetratricopeptide (TPR) repeat protein
MTVYFSLCKLCCMRPIAFSALFAVLPVLFPSTVNADVPALPTDRLEALLQSEFQFQSGHFNQAFSYYRSQSPAQLSAEELLRGSQLATVLGEGAWLATLDGAPALAEAAQVDLIRQRFERALQLDRSDTAQQAWQALLRHPDDRSIYASRTVAETNAAGHQATLNAALALYAGRTDLTPAERFELFQFAYQWRLEELADRLQGGLPPKSTEALLAVTIRECVDGAADACKRRLQRLDPLELSEWQRRSVLVLAKKAGDPEQNRRWIEALPQDGGTYYQRIVLLGRAMDDVQAQKLLAVIRKDSALDDFQRPVLLGSLGELLKDWPEAETQYREALAAGVPTTASVRLAVVMFRQSKRDAAFAQLQTVAADAGLSDEIRRDALQTEIQFHRILRSDERDVEVLNAVYRRGLAYWPQANPLRYQYAMRLFGQDRIDPAMSELQTILKIAPADADALNAYGFTLAKALNRPRAAYKPIAQAYLLAPEQPEILDSYGYVLFRLGRDKEALTHLEKAWRLTPSAVTAGHLGHVFLRLGDRQQAHDYLEKGLQLDASEAELLALQERLR